MIGWSPLLALPLGVVILSNRLKPWVFMWMLAFSIFAGLKWLSWWKARHLIPHSAWRSIAYLAAWPGMDAECFLDGGKRASAPPLRKWFWAGVETALGGTLLWVVARTLSPERPLLRGWVGMISLALLLHFGIFQIVALLWQMLGIDARPIMAAPLRSQSLRELWGKRWNLGFRDLAHDLIFTPLHQFLGGEVTAFLVFVVSGLIHDLVISLPARGGYGLPTIYFVIQGAGVAVERSSFGRQFGLASGFPGRLFTTTFSLGPVFLLFHPAFVVHVIIPFMKAIHAL